MKHLNLILAIFLAARTLAVRTECKGILLTAEGEKVFSQLKVRRSNIFSTKV
jgi:hypothetical protein